MNIFILSRDPREAARWLNDRHIVKMMVETAQLLSTACIHYGLPAPYRKTHANHPCAIWARGRAGNYSWLYQHGDEIGLEYTRRYGKAHRSHTALLGMETSIPAPPGMTPFPNVTPYGGDVVEAYRQLYRVEKRHLATWKSSPPPWWE